MSLTKGPNQCFGANPDSVAARLVGGSERHNPSGAKILSLRHSWAQLDLKTSTPHGLQQFKSIPNNRIKDSSNSDKGSGPEGSQSYNNGYGALL
mmetsp:Transcript_8925/g.14095  ORF Transcript_8925/g.14095 Transcript_8925/m.14095 type:complete len:94 (+) Transcript_8925:2351-2632(+)